jgi:hypothetical protein
MARYYAESDGGQTGSYSDPETNYVIDDEAPWPGLRMDCSSWKEAVELAKKLNEELTK